MSAYPALIGFGSNQGDSASIFDQVIDELSQLPWSLELTHSRLISTQPIGGPAGQPDYQNGCIRLVWNPPDDFKIEGVDSAVDSLSSAEILHRVLIDLELKFGRERRVRWGERTIDLDLLMFGEIFHESDRLTIPHPRMSFRRFVLKPGAEIAPKWVHAESGLTMSQLLDRNQKSQSPEVVVTGSFELIKSDLDVIRGRNTECDWDLIPGIPTNIEYDPASIDLQVHVRSTREAERLKGTGVPTLQLVVDDCEDFAAEIQAAIDSIRRPSA